MGNELKPCPFCGGEMRAGNYGETLRRLEIPSEDRFSISHVNEKLAIERKCPLAIEFFDTEQDAIEAWNTRAERTCRITATATDGLMTDDPKKRFWLSCGHDVGMYGLDIKPRYCPKCGAMVMNECIAECHDCGDGVIGWYCSACGNYIDENDNYCPSCGARVVSE